MIQTDLELLKYPIGPFQMPEKEADIPYEVWIQAIAELPNALEAALEGLSEVELDLPYRPEGWTVRQVVHHVADSHANALIRFKLALTENQPTIKPYLEGEWANLPDTQLPVEVSLPIIRGIHARWTVLLRHMSPTDFERTFMHPEHGQVFNLKTALGLYAWHGNHHVAHITELRKRRQRLS